MHKSTNKGFTLLELMVTLAVAGVIVAIAVPNFRDFGRNARLTTATNDLIQSINLARNEAIKRQTSGVQSVVACASNNPLDAMPLCSFGNFTGWIVFHDVDGNGQMNAGDALLDQHPTAVPGLTIKSDRSGFASFNVTGFANNQLAGRFPTTGIVLCDSRGTDPIGLNSYGRAIAISPTGRARATKVYAEVTNIMAIAGLTCP